jgi:hypothetical protein
MRRAVSILMMSILAVPLPALAGINKDSAMYIGGTVTSIPDQTEGKLDFTNAERMTFKWSAGSWDLPYKQITSLEYGQKAGRRVGVAIVFTVWALFSKKRRHFLTIGFKDADGNAQAALIEIGKNKTKASLAILEARTGLKVEYESEEAKKHVHG